MKALRLTEVARRLACDPRTVRRLIASGRLQGVKVGRVWRIPEADLIRFLETPTGSWQAIHERLERLDLLDEMLLPLLAELLRRGIGLQAEDGKLYWHNSPHDDIPSWLEKDVQQHIKDLYELLREEEPAPA